MNDRVKRLAQAQSSDIERRLVREGVRVLRARGRLDGPQRVVASPLDGGEDETLEADAVLLATGAAPRTLATAQPDGERILTWEQVYELDEAPTELIVVGSGVTGAEFASAYNALGVDVTLVSSRDRVLPGEDADAAEVLEEVFKRRGMTVLSKSRMKSVERHGDVGDRDADRRSHRRGIPLPARCRLRPEHRGHGSRGGGCGARRRRLRDGRPRLAHVGAQRVRRGRLHRRTHARVRRRHAGPDRDVALPRRRRLARST